MTDTKPLLSIPEFYAGRKIFITGGTGLIGKVLVWKLLNSCPLVGAIYLLIREKRDVGHLQRKEEVLNNRIFDNFRTAEKSYLLNKVKVIAGDVSKEGLGLSLEDRNILMNEIDLVMYGAALLNMDSSLKRAINVNTVGVFRTLKIFEERNVLDAFVYISTAYSCCTEVNVQEKIYPMKIDPDDMIRLITNLPDKMIEKITADIIHPQPNCYTFSKRVTEALINQHKHKFRIIIARPTIVLNAILEPSPGWVDTLNGPVGVAVATGVGVLRVMRVHPNKKGDLIPVDTVVNGLIALPWRRVQQKEENSCGGIPGKSNEFRNSIGLSKMSIYNLAMGLENSITWSRFQQLCKKINQKYPLSNSVWYTTCELIEPNKTLFEIQNFFYHVIPARIIDLLLFILRQKRFMIRTQRKISNGLKVLEYFSMREWRFSIKGLTQIHQLMSEEDQKIFPIFAFDLDHEKYGENGAIAIRKIFFNDDLSSVGKARIRMKMYAPPTLFS